MLMPVLCGTGRSSLQLAYGEESQAISMLQDYSELSLRVININVKVDSWEDKN